MSNELDKGNSEQGEGKAKSTPKRVTASPKLGLKTFRSVAQRDRWPWSRGSQKVHAEERVKVAQAETTDWVEALAKGKNTDDLELVRHTPVRIYLADGSFRSVGRVTNAVEQLVQALDARVTREGKPVKGSWFQDLVIRFKSPKTKKAMEETSERLKHAFEAHAYYKVQSEIDGAQAQAVAQLVTALRGEKSAAIQVGSLLVIKTTDEQGEHINAKSLSYDEMMFIQRNQAILKDPSRTIDLLAAAPPTAAEEARQDIQVNQVQPLVEALSAAKAHEQALKRLDAEFNGGNVSVRRREHPPI